MIAKEADESDCRFRDIRGMVALDVQNASNSVLQRGIIGELRRREIISYLIKIIRGYFTNRRLNSFTRVSNRPFAVESITTQCQKLGSRKELTLLAFAGDLTIVAKKGTGKNLETRFNHSIRLKCNWMETTKLKLVAKKA